MKDVDSQAKLTLNPSLIHVFTGPITRNEAIHQLAELLEEGGYVKNTFAQAVIDREKIFPTGLPTEPIGIAIPHTDTEHVIQGAIAVGVLPESVQFQEMGGSEDELVKVHIIALLAIAGPEAVATVLRQLAGAFQDPQFLLEVKEATNPQKVTELFNSKIPDVVEST